VRPCIGFVKRKTTIYCDSNLGHSQYVALDRTSCPEDGVLRSPPAEPRSTDHLRALRVVRSRVRPPLPTGTEASSIARARRKAKGAVFRGIPRIGPETRDGIAPALLGPRVRKLPHPAAKVAGHNLPKQSCLCTRGRPITPPSRLTHSSLRSRCNAPLTLVRQMLSSMVGAMPSWVVGAMVPDAGRCNAH